MEVAEAESRPAVESRWASQALDMAIARGEQEIFCRGMRGCGKTIDISLRLHNYAIMYPGMTQIWGRSTRSRLTDSVLKTFENEILGPGHPLYSSQMREQRHSYRYPNGSEIILAGLDDYERHKSVSADVIWINEVTEITENQWEEIGASSRQTMGSLCPVRFKIGDFNPVHPEHWTAKRCAEYPERLYPRVLDDGARMAEWFTPQMYYDTAAFNVAPVGPHQAKLIAFTIADNAGYWSVDPWGWKPPGLSYAQNVLGKMSGARKARYLEGRPKGDEGAVFPEFDEDIHLINDFEPLEDWQPNLLLYDPGHTHPTSALWVARAPDHGIFVYDGYHVTGGTVQGHCAVIHRRNRENNRHLFRAFADPQAFFSDTAAGNCNAQARAVGMKFLPWPRTLTGEVEGRIDSLRQLFLNTVLKENGKLPVGTPYIRICRRCEGLIGNLRAWNFKRSRTGDLLKGDKAYVDADNDAIDALLGGISTGLLTR